MAESFLFSIAESLLSKLASRAFEEASQVLGLYDNLKEFTKTLSLVKAVLLDAEQQQEQEHKHELREWTRQIKHVFYDAEDVLDEFECQTLRKQVVKAHGTTKDKVGHFFSTSNPLVFRYRMAQQIKDISERLDKVASDRHKFGLRTIDVETRVVHTRELTHSRVANSDVIGREHDKEKIIQLLIEPNLNDEDKSLHVIPIVGIGGLGKTTLAKIVFNDSRIDECFQLKMWVCVSDNFDITQLIIKIINSDNDSASSSDAPLSQQNLNMLDLEPLQRILTNKLADKKFLLVLDDVWNEDRFKWLELRNLMQVCAIGSKILVTTRSQTIASMMGTIPSHILEGLSLKNSLSLFVKWAFKEGDEEKYPHLVDIGREIVKRCKGLPLAVRTLGSLLFSKFGQNEWENVRDSKIWNIPQKKGDILPVLQLSYDLMPSYLKQCFSLFSLYPKDSYFNSFEIILLWGALGLLASPENDRTPEDIGHQYLFELQSRSLLQNFVDMGILYEFSIHDLVHDLALFVAKDVCLLINSPIQNIPENVRHLSFAENNLLDNSFITKSVAVRTIFFQNATIEGKSEVLPNTFVSKFKYLRFLDLSYSAYKTLPRSISKLKHLRYFSIANNSNITRLPSSICKLQNLQVLNLVGCTKLEGFPKGLRKLINLNQLEITTNQSILPENEIANLSSLTKLNIESRKNLESIFGEVTFPILKILNIKGCERLRYLLLDATKFHELEILCINNCVNLDLNLWNYYNEVQSSKLKLKFVQFYYLPQLRLLPQWLQTFTMSLQCLSISYCDNFKIFPEWLSTLVNLKTLVITNCINVLSLPNDIHRLTKLEVLIIHGCPKLYSKCQPLVGEFWPKISHIKQIFIDEIEKLYEEEEEEME